VLVLTLPSLGKQDFSHFDEKLDYDVSHLVRCERESTIVELAQALVGQTEIVIQSNFRTLWIFVVLA